MTYEAFVEMMVCLKKNYELSNKFHELGFDDILLKEDLEKAMDVLLATHFSEEGAELINSWLFDDSWNKKILDDDGKEVMVLENPKQVWEYVELIRKANKNEEYKPKVPMSEYQIKQVIEGFFKGD